MKYTPICLAVLSFGLIFVAGIGLITGIALLFIIATVVSALWADRIIGKTWFAADAPETDKMDKLNLKKGIFRLAFVLSLISGITGAISFRGSLDGANEAALRVIIGFLLGVGLIWAIYFSFKFIINGFMDRK